MPIRRVLIALGVALALADASVVTLALPPMLVELDTTVQGVAAVIGVYTLVLTSRCRRPRGCAAASATGCSASPASSSSRSRARLCALPDTLGPLLALRGVQAVGAAAALVAGFAFLGGGTAVDRGRRVRHRGRAGARRRADRAFDWRAIFVSGLPVARRRPPRPRVARGRAGAGGRAAAPAADPRPPPTRRPRPALAGALVALAAVSAALTGVLFLLVLLLVSGWSLEPLAAAAAVSVLPLAALAGARIRGDAATRAAPAARSSAGGVLALAVLPGATIGVDRRAAGARRRSAWAWRCRRSPASCSPSARRGRPRACSRSATPASRSRC